MWADLRLSPLTAADLEWATGLERRAAAGRRWTVGGFVPHPGAHADLLANGAEHVLVARGSAGERRALVWVYRRGEQEDHAYLSLLADPAAPDGAAVLTLAGAVERHLRARPTGRVLLEVTEPNRGPLARLLDAVFEETARLRRSAWMDGGWHDVSVWSCDAARWRALVGPEDDLADLDTLLDRLCPRATGPTALHGSGHDGDLARAVLAGMVERDPGCVRWTLDHPTPPPMAPLSDHLDLDSLGALVLAATVADVTGADLEDVLEHAAALSTFGDLAELLGRYRRVPV